MPISLAYAENEIYNTVPTPPSMKSSIHTSDPKLDNVNNQLYLLVYINDTNTSKIVNFFEQRDKKLYASAEQLRQLRLKIDSKIDNHELISLSDISQLKYDYKIEEQELHISIPQEQLQSYVIDLKSPQITNEELEKFKPLNSALINYSLYNTYSNQKNDFAASLEGRLSTRYGNITHNMVYRDQNNNGQYDSFIRLDSYWQYIDPIKIRSYKLGDFITHTPDWGNSVRLAGLQWSSAYEQRADIITAALPQFSSSAALPSTLDLFINQQKVYTGQVPSGPFDIKSLPYISGNDVTLVTKDIHGQQVKTTQQYYYSQHLLSKDINQFSIDIGIPRYNFGTSSYHYDSDVVFASGSFRTGLNNHLTIDTNSEFSSDGLVQLGLGFTSSLFNRGIFSLSAAQSKYKDQYGNLLLVGLEGRIQDRLSLNSSYQKTFNQYYNLARVADIRFRDQLKPSTQSENNFDYTALAKDILQIGFSWKFNHGISLSGNFHHLETNHEQYRNASVSLGGRIRKNLNFYGTAYSDLNQTENYGIYFSLMHNPTHKTTALASYSQDSQASSYRLQLDTTNSQAIGDLGWGMSVEQSNKQSNEQHVYLNYLARSAFLSMDYTQSGPYKQTVFSATGALLAASGKLFATNKIGDSFAIVEDAGPNSQIINGGVNLGKTDSKGRFLISSLIPYSKHNIYLDPTYLPIDWIPGSTQKTVITGYNQGTRISFDTHKSISTTLVLHDKHHQPLAPGYSVSVNDRADASMTGYGGEVYITDLKPRNKLSIDLLDEGRCEIEFEYASSYSTTNKIGPYVCK